MKNFFFWMLILTRVGAIAKEEPKYAIADIPEHLKEGMYAVVREQESTFYIHNRNSSSYKVRTVISILNSNARKYSALTLGYDKFVKIENLKASVYDKDGGLIRKLKANEIVDQSYVSDYSLYEDNRIKHIDLDQNTYPYTIEFEYVISYKYLYAIPKFDLYTDDEIAIQKTTYGIVYPIEYRPRYKLNKIGEPTIAPSGKDVEKMSWTFENVKPEKFESLSSAYNVIPNIIAGPNDFEFDGHVGKMDTWKNLGKWQMQLNKGRDILPELTKQTVRKLTSAAKNQEEKIKVLYEFMQNKTRYVSIQRGIGGFQPFDATSVDQLGYGDCKALSNYMVALLKEADITAYYTQIYAGTDNRPVPKDFTIDYFNHIVVAVPGAIDTVWLECTSQTMPFGYLGSFTCNRYALMITDEGGVLVRTPSYTAEQNKQSRSANVFVDIKGNAKASVRTTYSGLQYENNGLDNYITSSTEAQKKWLQKSTHIPSFDVSSFKMTNNRNKIPSAVVKVDLILPLWATVSGKRIFVAPNLMNRSTFIPERTESRKVNFVLKMPYTDIDTIHYHLPEGIYPEFLPESIKLNSRFGEYESTFSLDQGNLIYIRKLKMNKGEFPPESYKEFSEFYKAINKADNLKIVFMSKT